MAPTIRDVARLAKVAPSTVSAVLNQKGYVHTETITRVRAAIELLDYTPSRTARKLATQKSGNIGFIVSDTHFSRAEPFYTRVFIGTEIEARKHDFYVLLTSVGDRYSGRDDLPRFIKEQNADGVIVAGKVPGKLIRDLERLNYPLVLVDYGGNEESGSRVLIENKGGIALITDHLIKLGHRDIGYIGGEPDHVSAGERIRGFSEAMADAGLTALTEWIDFIEPEMGVGNGAAAFSRIWRKNHHPTALVCSNDAMAIGAIRCAQEMGLVIPGDLSVTGFDDVESGRLLMPPLTTVRVFKEDLGAVAIQILVDLINSRNDREFVTRVGVELVTRKSTAPLKAMAEL